MLVLNDANEWKGVFIDLPVWKEGNPIQYTVLEDAVPGYVPNISGDKDKGFVIVNSLAVIPTPGRMTGDDSMAAAWLMLMLIATAGLACFAALKIRRFKKDEEI